LLSILIGEEGPGLEDVVESSAGDNIYIFIAGHGNENGVYLGLNEAIPAPGGHYSILAPSDLSRAVSSMFEQQRYRHMLIAIEACHGGTMGSELDAPGAILISGANPFENSLSANYDLSQRIWLADEFAYHLWEIASRSADTPLDDVYRDLYLKMNGSHVSVYAPASGYTMHNEMLREFLEP
jgi:glycosylphosphatidylinositol transamidase (GPIT) subunit GPI8